MNVLHAYFNLRQQQAFQRLLDGSSSRRGQASSSSHVPSSSGGKSWSKRSPLTSSAQPPVDVNARDSLGRTVLHLAATAPEPSATEYVRLLLTHPNINVNLQDSESHWTALHRALYYGNIESAILLLQRPEIDTSLKDTEGYTAFDLYNSTLEGTKPDEKDISCAALFTWGANRNATLGHGGADDRAHPEPVAIRPIEGSVSPEKATVDARFNPLHVREVVMSKLHTAVVTTEAKGNLRVCGFGSGGRLGPGQHTQYSLVPLPQFTQTVASVALGQDHSLALTKSGEVYSWGLNRFSQLGYAIETSAGTISIGKSDEVIQSTARKVAGPLKGKTVVGVAACKTASACWTVDEVFTWGTNNGQLGYDKASQPVQIIPRKVTKVTQPVLSATITDSVLACLLVTQDVICIWNDGHFKVNFPAYTFPSEIAPYRPPHAINNTSIKKITSCDDMVAALSSNGELFTFALPSPSERETTSQGKQKAIVQPQRVWALRKQFSAVKDVALGSDGSIVICTESGHVFVRERNPKSSQSVTGKAFKFHRMPYLQRVVRVCANSTGAYGALRIDHQPEMIPVTGRFIAEDLADIQPHLRVPDIRLDEEHRPEDGPALDFTGSPAGAGGAQDYESDDEGQGQDIGIQKDIKLLKNMCGLLDRDRELRQTARGRGVFDGAKLLHGADMMVRVESGLEFPAHRVILAARCPTLCEILHSGDTLRDDASGIVFKATPRRAASLCKLTVSGCQPLSVLILLSYLYSDEVVSIWDRRVGRTVEQQLVRLKIKPAQVKTDLQHLARILDLRLLAEVLAAPVKRTPVPSMVQDMSRLLQSSQEGAEGGPLKRSMRDPLAYDVVLQLEDRDVYTHATILRARSPFFAAFFDDEDWTARRWTAEGTIEVNLKHMKWRVMEFVMRFMCGGEDSAMFDVLDHIHSSDELADFMFDVMAAANELLLDRLILICSSVITKRVNISNVGALLADASHFNAMPLVRSLQGYLAVNMETLLESRYLDDLPVDLIRQLSSFIRQQQALKYPLSRSNSIVEKALKSAGDWLMLQDIPEPIIPTFRPESYKDSPKLSPPTSSKRLRRQPSLASPPSSPLIRPQFTARTNLSGPPDDEMFLMDEPDVTPITPSTSDSPGKSSGWKTISSAPRVEMKAIIAEAQTTKLTPSKSTIPLPMARVPSGGANTSPWRVATREVAGSGRTVFDDQDRIKGASPGIPRPASGPSWRSAQTPTATAPSTPILGAVDRAFPSLSSPQAKSERSPGVVAPSNGPASPGTPRASAQTQRQSGSQAGMGPIFTPSRQQSSSSLSKGSPGIRRVGSGSVWTPPPVQPVVQPSASTSGMSFVAIQQLQLEQGASPAKDKRSLKEIQEEERARQVEEDFLKWWAAEEARVEAEQRSALEAIAAANQSKSKKPSKNPKSKAKPSSSHGSSHKSRKGKATATPQTVAAP